MKIDDWQLYYKIHETENYPTTTQMCYEPRVNPEGSVFCMNFSYPNDYQLNQPRISYTKEMVDLMFEREVEYLEKMKEFVWAPEVLDISNNKIFIKWYGGTCNGLVYSSRNLETKYPRWKSDLTSIILEQVDNGYLKSSVYPHSHYYDDNGNMRTIDFYTTVEKNSTHLEYETIKGIVGLDTDRFIDARKGDKIDIEEIFKSGLLQYGKWPENLKSIYREIYDR